VSDFYRIPQLMEGGRDGGGAAAGSSLGWEPRVKTAEMETGNGRNRGKVNGNDTPLGVNGRGSFSPLALFPRLVFPAFACGSVRIPGIPRLFGPCNYERGKGNGAGKVGRGRSGGPRLLYSSCLLSLSLSTSTFQSSARFFGWPYQAIKRRDKEEQFFTSSAA